MKPIEVAQLLANNCDDDAILVEVLDNHFDKLSDKDKRTVVEILMGNLSTARVIGGYGPKAVGAK